jgi:hypothetical protein
MKHHTLLRLGGLALIGSAVTSLAGGMAHPVVAGDSHSVDSLLAPGSPWGQLSIYAGALLLMFGLPAAYAWLAPRTGVLGFLGFSLYFLGNAVSAQGHLYVEALVAPEIARRAPELIAADGSIVAAPAFALAQVVGGLVLVVGLGLMSVALLRAPGLPRWIGVVGLVGTVLAVAPLPEVAVLTGLQIEVCRGLVVAALGVLLLRSLRVGDPLPTRAPVTV